LGADSSWQFMDGISAHDLYIMGTLSTLSLAKKDKRKVRWCPRGCNQVDSYDLFLSKTKTGGALALLAL
jgi:hypothetical protein